MSDQLLLPQAVLGQWVEMPAAGQRAQGSRLRSGWISAGRAGSVGGDVGEVRMGSRRLKQQPLLGWALHTGQS